MFQQATGIGIGQAFIDGSDLPLLPFQVLRERLPQVIRAVAVGGAGQFVEGRDQGVIGAERDYGAHFLINFVFDVYGVYSENECIRKLSGEQSPGCFVRRKTFIDQWVE